MWAFSLNGATVDTAHRGSPRARVLDCVLRLVRPVAREKIASNRSPFRAGSGAFSSCQLCHGSDPGFSLMTDCAAASWSLSGSRPAAAPQDVGGSQRLPGPHDHP